MATNESPAAERDWGIAAPDIATTVRDAARDARALASHGSLFLGIVAVCKGVVSLSLLGVGLDPVLLLIGFLGAVTIYTHNKLTDLGEDAVNRPDQAAFVESRRGTLAAISAVAYLAALGLSLRGGLDALAITLAPGVAAVLYSEDWLPVTDVDRLKDVAIVNTAVVAGAWALPLAALPAAFDEPVTTTAVWVVGAFLFVRTVVGGEVMNVRDVDGDRAAGVGTLPVLLGVPRTRLVLYALDLLTGAVLVAGALLGILPGVLALALCAILPYSLAVTRRLGRTADHRRLGTLKDGEYLLMAAVVSLTTLPVG